MTPSEIIDAIIDDRSASEVSDAIKDVLFAKSSGRIDDMRGNVASSLFGEPDQEEEEEEEYDSEEESEEDEDEDEE
jgi:hypothetical protein